MAMHFKITLVFCLICASPATPQINVSCRSPRSGTCTLITSCPYYMNQFKQKPRPRSLLTEVKQNLCGINLQTPKVCCPQHDDGISDHENFSLLPVDTCGPISYGPRIVNGAKASPREFPWMALIAYKTGDSEDDQDFKCAGSLISVRYVLTAAHCLDDKTLLGVRLGEYDLSKDTECYHKNNIDCEPPVQDILIDKIIIHKSYTSVQHTNDIGLIRLSTPANIKYDNVKPICLPIGKLKTNLLGKSATVTGWGTTETGHKSMVLSKVSIPVVPLNKCIKAYGVWASISKTQICAGGYKGRDSCSGDSGGPLQYIVTENQRYVQVGIVSYGAKKCGLSGWPAIYTNVKEYMSWILDNIEP